MKETEDGDNDGGDECKRNANEFTFRTHVGVLSENINTITA